MLKCPTHRSRKPRNTWAVKESSNTVKYSLPVGLIALIALTPNRSPDGVKAGYSPVPPLEHFDCLPNMYQCLIVDPFAELVIGFNAWIAELDLQLEEFLKSVPPWFVKWLPAAATVFFAIAGLVCAMSTVGICDPAAVIWLSAIGAVTGAIIYLISNPDRDSRNWIELLIFTAIGAIGSGSLSKLDELKDLVNLFYTWRRGLGISMPKPPGRF
ncbi:hypothetical protein [Thermobifida halotolerans]|uniref:hypothetical protein n=1 Tax=Thermobifida halotolerans TaxID=483545 RepID=UPI001F3D0740|nr:hypothetical protein [Thermobifida halotolerans]